MTKEMRINLDVETTKLQRILKAVSKHTGALAEELAEIDAIETCDCGGYAFKTEDILGTPYIGKKCVDCGEMFVINMKWEDGE